MLQQQHRFHGHGSLRYVYKHGAAVRTSLCTLKYIANPRRRHSRFSVVISKKVLKSAVRRNRVRRRLYEVIRQELPQLVSGVDVVCIVVSAELVATPHQELTSSVRQLFSQARLYK